MFFLGKKNIEIFTDTKKYVKTMCGKAIFPIGIGLRVFVRITVENSLK